MNKPAGFPDFFVVGAPRSGTTALCRYLSRNPGICFSRPKETHYFTQHEEMVPQAALKRDYVERFFDHRTADNLCAGEGSVSYLYLPGPIEHIQQINPDAKFIAMVRNPLTMMPSYHQHMLFLLQEDESDFAEAWNLQSARAGGNHIPDTCLDPKLLMYDHVSRLGAQIERLFSIAGRERSHVIVFDDFKANTLDTYRAVLDFLDVKYDGQTELERRYESQMYRFRWLQRLMFLPAMHSAKALHSVQRRKRNYREDGSKKPDLIRRLTDLNKVAARPAALSEQMATTIREHVRDDVQLLSELLDRDLSFWLANDPPDRS